MISIFGIGMLLGIGLFFLKPNRVERKFESQKPPEAEKKIETVGTVNPLVNLAMQATEPKLLDSLNKTSFDLLSKVRPAIVKITRSSGYSLGCALTQGGLIATPARNLNRTKPVDIVLSTGGTAKAKWMGNDTKSGISFLKLEEVVAPATVDLNEAYQMGDFLLVVGRDPIVDVNVVLRSNVNGRLQDQAIVFYLPKFIEDTFVFNTQGQLLGIGEPLKGSRDGTMTMIPAAQINAALKPLISQ